VQAARMLTLFQDDRNASQKNLQDARAAAQADQARLAVSNAALAGLVTSLRQQFGDALARAAASPGSGTWRQLVSGQAAVLRVVFPAAGAAPEGLAIDAPAGGELSAHKLSAAPQVDPILQGTAYFYLIPAPLPVGTRTVAHAASGQLGEAGVLVPDEAIIWYGDARWAYVKTAGERFTRRLVQGAVPSAGGVLASAGLRAGDEVVTRGAALLLSEEQRPHGIATQCKDPPECDD
jgi:membrane fusion protein, multidrug efflux system